MLVKTTKITCTFGETTKIVCTFGEIALLLNEITYTVHVV